MKAMPIRFFLCPCRMTWTGAIGDDLCAWCGLRAVDCSPWSGDGRAWFHARMADEVTPGVTKAQAVMEARYVDQRSMRRSIYRGIVARGNTSCRGVARG